MHNLVSQLSVDALSASGTIGPMQSTQPTPRLAVNTSPQAEALLQSGEITFDLLKCPAWPETVRAALEVHAAYVHFPLRVGIGIGDAEDTEQHAPAVWKTMEALLEVTGTPWISLHLAPSLGGHLWRPEEPETAERLAEAALSDIESVVARFGRERVIVENVPESPGLAAPPAIDPQWICQVIEAAGCGFLLDVSHARRAARHLGMDEKDYITKLPLAQTREIHVTGLQRLEGRWLEATREMYDDAYIEQHLRGRWQDHLPITDVDWAFLDWCVEEVRAGHWGRPEIVAFEYGGVGPFFRATTDSAVLREQVPRLWELVHRI